MINLRYHIVSITAVFLALGIGVALGSTLIQRATVDTLERRLDEQSDRLDQTDGENDQLRAEAAVRAERDAELASSAPPRLFADRLAGVPVLVIATRGVDEDRVVAVRRSLRDADSRVAGTLWITERWARLSATDVAELAELTGISFGDPGVARRVVVRLVASELAAATRTTTVDGLGSAAAPPTAVIRALAAAGFFDLELDTAGPLLQGGGARYVVVSDEPSVLALTDSLVLVTLLDAMAEAGPTATVVVGPEPRRSEEPDDPGTVAAPLPLVERVRSDPGLTGSISTVEGIDDLVGRTAMVLALEDVTLRRYGHYGTGPGAVSLLPPPLP